MQNVPEEKILKADHAYRLVVVTLLAAILAVAVILETHLLSIDVALARIKDCVAETAARERAGGIAGGLGSVVVRCD